MVHNIRKQPVSKGHNLLFRLDPWDGLEYSLRFRYLDYSAV